MSEIDFVIPYVDDSDPKWIDIFNQYSFSPHFGDGNVLTRYNGGDTLKYVLRSIEMYAPWIRKVHLLVMQDSQVPEWINRETVHIVYHKDFIPEKYLPLFNSSAIEMYLCNIPDCSEHFLYGNDDSFFNSVVYPSDYFGKDKIKQDLTRNKYKNGALLNAAYISTFMNSAKLAMHDTNMVPIRYEMMLMPHHHIKPAKLSNIQHIYKLYEQQIESSITKFREEKNLNQYLYTFYECTHDLTEKSNRKCSYTRNIKKDRNHILNVLNDSSIIEICVNDVQKTTPDDKVWLQSKLELKFPNKSKYEI